MNAAMDEHLADRLAGMLTEADPVPDDVLTAARAALAFRDLDTAVAALIRDSADEPELAGVRDSEPDRLLSFELPSTPEPITVEVQVGSVAAQRRDLVGQVAGAALAAAGLEAAGERRELQIEDGFFIARAVPAGPVRMVFTTDAGARIATSWVRL